MGKIHLPRNPELYLPLKTKLIKPYNMSRSGIIRNGRRSEREGRNPSLAPLKPPLKAMSQIMIIVTMMTMKISLISRREAIIQSMLGR